MSYDGVWADLAEAPIPEMEALWIRERQARQSTEDKMVALMATLVEAVDKPGRAENRKEDQFRAKFLTTLNIPPFSGHINTKNSEYRDWRRTIQIWQDLNKISDRELAGLLHSQLKGRSFDLIDWILPEDLQEERILDWIWDIYDENFLQESWIVLEKTELAWERLSRNHAEPITDYLTRFQKCLREKEIQDPGTKISQQAVASKMLRTCILSDCSLGEVDHSDNGYCLNT